MTVRKICRPKGCRGSPRCEHPWWFDVMHAGKRWRMRVDEFAIARGATEPVASKQTAERVWEPKFLGEIIAGRDPHEPPEKARPAGELTVAEFLDRYYTNYVEAEWLKSADTVSGHLKALKATLGELPVSALEKPAEIARFKGEYRHGRTVATVNRALGVLRAAINWGRFQDPPLLSTTPFHRFGVTISPAADRFESDGIFSGIWVASRSSRMPQASEGWCAQPAVATASLWRGKST